MKRVRLAQRRKAVGLSQEKLAELLGVDPSTVRRWERADTDPQPWHRPHLAKALRVSLDQLAGLLADVVRTNLRQHVPDALEVSTLASVSPAAGNQRLTQLRHGIAAVAAASRLLDGHAPAGSRQLGTNDLARLNALIALYRSVDREYGGGAVCDDVARFAESASSLLAQSYSAGLTSSLLRSVAAVRQLAGWTAFDACRHVDAQRHLQSAERAAVVSGDLVLAASIRYCQARQLQHLRHNQDALDTLRLARHQLGRAATPAVTAVLLGAEAASLAALGDRSGALAALGHARDAFDRIDREREPDWVAFYDQGELLAQFGRVYRDFARDDRRNGEAAVRWVTEALPAYGPQHIRSTVLSGVSLCSALFLAGEPEQALIVGQRVIDQARQLDSPRIFDRIRNVTRDAADFLSLPDVAAFAQTVSTISPGDG